MTIPQAAPFPPSAADSPFTYGLALFSLVTMVAIALAVLLAVILGEKRRRQFTGDPRFQVFNTYRRSDLNFALRTALISFCVFILFGATPDALILLLWGEIEQDTLGTLMTLDRLFDGVIIVPFLLGAGILAWSRQSLQQATAEVRRNLLPPFTWRAVAAFARIPVVIIIIAAGVTLGKATS